MRSIIEKDPSNVQDWRITCIVRYIRLTLLTWIMDHLDTSLAPYVPHLLDPNDTSFYGYTAFFEACKYNHLEMIRFLLADSRIEVNKNPRQWNALDHVCLFESPEVLELLISSPLIDLNRRSPDSGHTPFILACEYDRLKSVEILLQDPRIHPYLTTNLGESAFYMACKNGHKDIVKILLEFDNIDFNKPTIEGSTPFYEACKKMDIELIKILLKESRIDHRAELPTKNTSFNHLFDPIPANWTPFSKMCATGYLEGVELLLSYWDLVDLDSKIEEFTPAQWAEKWSFKGCGAT